MTRPMRSWRCITEERGWIGDRGLERLPRTSFEITNNGKGWQQILNEAMEEQKNDRSKAYAKETV